MVGTDSCCKFLLTLTIVLIQDCFLIEIVKIVMQKGSLDETLIFQQHRTNRASLAQFFEKLWQNEDMTKCKIRY